MEQYLNIIQLVSGIAGIASIFIGLFLTIRKLNKEDSTTKIPSKTIKISTALIVLGLLLYAVTKTCTSYANRDQDYDVMAIYFASLIDVVKMFGFVALIPVLLNVLRRKSTKRPTEKEDLGQNIEN